MHARIGHLGRFLRAARADDPVGAQVEAEATRPGMREGIASGVDRAVTVLRITRQTEGLGCREVACHATLSPVWGAEAGIVEPRPRVPVFATGGVPPRAAPWCLTRESAA